MRAGRGLDVAMFLSAAAYTLCLVVAGPETATLGGPVLATVVLLLPLAVLVRHGSEVPQDRPWTLALALGVCLYLFGNGYYLAVSTATEAPFPSPADVGFLGIYPLLLAGLLLALREHLRKVRLIVALDGLTGTLAGAALATCAIAPLIRRVWDGSLSAATTLAYPVCAVVLVAASLGALGIVGPGRGRHFPTWMAGMLLFGVGDIVYAYQLANGTYRLGTPLDATWAIGLVLVAAGAVRLQAPSDGKLPGARSLVVVTAASVTSVLVLAAAPAWSDNPLPTALALLALAGCGLRFVLAFLQLRELAAVREQALTDELTGVANRRALYADLDRLFQAGAGARGRGQWAVDNGFALALIDLDHFKEVNDSFGHAVGDDLLRAVVERFSTALRQLQTPHLLARLGGDEFAVVLHGAGSRNAALACASALQDALAEPVDLGEVVLHVQASVGVAIAPLHAQNRADMLFAADAAMYAAKTSGEPVRFHAPSAVGDRRKRLEVAEDLYGAIERDELTVEYQPIVRAGGSDLVGAEALVRWDHPTRGRLTPAEFLGTAERYRLTPAIAERVLDLSLADLARWRSRGADLTVSVNVSASDLRDEGLVRIVAAALLKHQVPPESLVIEITETAMMRDPELAQVVMHALDALGVQLAVDDYGTGYSSLEYLLKLPINQIKLDRTFCTHLVTELRAAAIVRSTVDLTHALGLRMVAEGVENEGTLFILRELGCDLVQGWHLGRPMPARSFETLLALHRRRGAEAP